MVEVKCAICAAGLPCYPPSEREILMQIDAWLSAMPSEYEHGDPIHGKDGILARLRRGEWRASESSGHEGGE